MIRSRRSAAVVVATLALVLGACAKDDKDDTSTKGTDGATTTTTAAPKDRSTDPAYEGPGPYQAGTETIALDDGRRVVVWYPATKAAADTPKVQFDIASLLSPALQAKIPAKLRPQYDIDAHQGAAPAQGGPFPVVLFSHGYAGYPEQSADLVTHLAQWGFVVVAPDHVERSLDGLLGTAGQGVPKKTDPEVLSASLDAAEKDAEDSASPLHDLLDTEEVAVIGHSAGAAAAYRTASSDPRIKAFISYSVGLTGQGNTTPPPVPDVPGMVMTGSEDGIIPAKTSIGVYDGMKAPKELVEIGKSGHLVFSDICLIGKDQGGLVSLVKQAGLDLPDHLLRLADDGCGKEYLDPTKAFPAIDHLSVAFLRAHLGVDEAPVGLAPGVAKAFPDVDLTIRQAS